MDEERRRKEAHTQATEDGGCAGLCHLLLIDGLHDRCGAKPARLARPRQPQPATLVQEMLPAPLHCLVCVLAIAAHAAVTPLGREISIQPASDLVSEGLFLSSEAQVHVIRRLSKR